MEAKTTEQSPTDTHNDKLVAKCRDAKGNGDPAKYLAGLTVADAHALANLVEALQSEQGEIAGIADRLLRQADCLDRYAEQSGFPEKPVPSVFHLQSSHFRDLAKELAALNRSAKL